MTPHDVFSKANEVWDFRNMSASRRQIVEGKIELVIIGAALNIQLPPPVF